MENGRRRESEGCVSDGEKLTDKIRSLFRFNVFKALIRSMGVTSMVSMLLFVFGVEMAKDEELSFDEISTRRWGRLGRLRAVEDGPVGVQGDREGRGSRMGHGDG